MRPLILFQFFLLSLGCSSSAKIKTEKNLFPIIENGLWGYINDQGSIVIKPQFKSAGQFSEGCAPVRLKGTYGFIDETGQFIISPKYDIAYPYKNGRALVYLDSKPYFINKKGEILFEHQFTRLSEYNKYGLCIVEGKKENQGVIDLNGKLIIDTLYAKIESFNYGVTVVRFEADSVYLSLHPNEKKYQYAVFDTKGKVIIPFNTYQSIDNFTYGYSLVERYAKNQKEGTNYEFMIDSTGKLVMEVPCRKWSFDYYEAFFSEGLAPIYLYASDPYKGDQSRSGRFDHTACGVINLKGEIIFSSNKWEKITPYSCGRAFAMDKEKKWYLLDKEGRILNKTPFTKVFYNEKPYSAPFIRDTAFVAMGDQLLAINMNGDVLSKTNSIDYRIEMIQRQDNYLVLYAENKYGYWNPGKNLWSPPIYDNLTASTLNDRLICVIKNDTSYYVNKNGKSIWNEKTIEATNFKPLDIDFMYRGYFYAWSPEPEEQLGGYAISRNGFKALTALDKKITNQFMIVVKTDTLVDFNKISPGYQVDVINTTKSNIYFSAQDSRLYMKVQAKNKKGEWKDIEYLPSSWCGNSYHTMYLPPQQKWSFITPVYAGEFNTVLRISLEYKKSTEYNAESFFIYSSEYKGSVNPAQFWNKHSYYPTNLMDPYYD